LEDEGLAIEVYDETNGVFSAEKIFPTWILEDEIGSENKRTMAVKSRCNIR
jgi:hypothetical protein